MDLSIAIKNFDVPMIQELLAAGADPNTLIEGESLLSIVIDEAQTEKNEEKAVEILKLLLEAGADPNLGKKDLLIEIITIWGIFDSDDNIFVKDMLKLLIKHGATRFDPSDLLEDECFELEKDTGKYPNILHFCCVLDDFRSAMFFVENGFASCVNTQDSYGDTILHKMATTCRVRSLKKLIECGADISIKNKEGKTPLDMFMFNDDCYKYANIQNMIVLIKRGAIPSETLRDNVVKSKCIDALIVLLMNKDELDDDEIPEGPYREGLGIYDKFYKSTKDKYNLIAKFMDK